MSNISDLFRGRRPCRSPEGWKWAPPAFFLEEEGKELDLVKGDEQHQLIVNLNWMLTFSLLRLLHHLWKDTNENMADIGFSAKQTDDSIHIYDWKSHIPVVLHQCRQSLSLYHWFFSSFDVIRTLQAVSCTPGKFDFMTSLNGFISCTKSSISPQGQIWENLDLFLSPSSV